MFGKLFSLHLILVLCQAQINGLGLRLFLELIN